MPLAFVRWMPRMNVFPTVFCCSTPEYVPDASQCQTSTAAPESGLQVEASTTVSRNVSATPGLPSVMLRRTLSPSGSTGLRSARA